MAPPPSASELALLRSAATAGENAKADAVEALSLVGGVVAVAKAAHAVVDVLVRGNAESAIDAVRRLYRAVLLAALGRFLVKYRERIAYALIRRPGLVARLPGPGPELIRGPLGHMSGPLFFDSGFDFRTFRPEMIPRITVEKMTAAYPRWKKDGMMRFVGGAPWVPLLNQLAVVVPTDLRVVREILASRSMPRFRKGISYDVADPLIGQSILHSSGPFWAAQRPVVEKGFSHTVMEASMPRVLQTANELVARWAEAAEASHNMAEQDVAADMLKLTMDVIGRAAFTYDFNSVTARTSEEAPLYGPFQIILYAMNRRIMLIHEHLLRWLPTARNAEIDGALGKLDAFVDDILKKQAARPKDPNRKPDFLDVLVETAAQAHGDNAKEVWTYKTLRDNLKTLLFAGHDTTGAMLAWTLHLLATHPGEMAKVRQEILDKFGAAGDPTYDDLERMPVLNAVVLEAARLYPSAGFTRMPNEDTVLNGYVVPRMTEILILPWLFHRDAEHWDRPNEFLPERMLNEGLEHGQQQQQRESVAEDGAVAEEMATQATNQAGGRVDSLQSRIARIAAKKAFLPFSLGPRNCVGRPLALLEMRVVLIKLLQRFSFAPVENDPEFSPWPVLTLTLNPASIKLVPRLA